MNVLRSLKQFDKATAELILARLTDELLPDPGLTKRTRTLDVTPEAYSVVKQEIHSFLKLDPEDLSAPARAKLFNYLASQMSQLSLLGVDLEIVKRRIGDRGDLRQDLYDVDVAKFRFPLANFGIRPNHIEDAVKYPDDVQQILPDRYPGLFVYLKIHNKLSDNQRFALLVIGQKSGHTIFVVNAWRFYHSRLDLESARNPLDYLMMFVELYGIPITIGLETGKFFLYEKIETHKGTRMDEIIKIPKDDSGGGFVCYVFQKSSIEQLYELALVFVIDRIRYVSDLRKHGVPANDDFPYRPPGHLF